MINNIYLVAGDSHVFNFVPFILKDCTQATNATHSLSLLIRGLSALDITGSNNSANNGWVCALNTTQSLSLQASNYTCAVVLTATNFRETVEQFTLVVKPNLANLATYDARLESEKALEECQKALAKFNNEGVLVKKIQIGSRIMEFNSITELLALADYWQKQVYINKKNELNKQGKKPHKMIQISFTKGC